MLSSFNETFIVEDILTRKIVQEFSIGHGNPYHRHSPIKITPNGKYLLAQKGNFEAKNMILSMWKIDTGQYITSFEACKGMIQSIDITGDSRYAVVLAYDPNSVIRVIDLHTGELTLSINPDTRNRRTRRHAI